MADQERAEEPAAEWTPEGPFSYYVTLEMGTAIVAMSEQEAKDRFLANYVKSLPSTGWESYGRVEWRIVPGPRIVRPDDV